MKSILMILAVLLAFNHAPAQSWSESLRKMPAPTGQPINRSNCIERVLKAFQPDDTVKAIIFLPSVSDDFYLINRGAPPINLRGGNLFDVIGALTNSTEVQATFRQPFLLLHMPNEPTRPGFEPKSPGKAAELGKPRKAPEMLCIDQHWSSLQPELSARLKTRLGPAADSRDAWHFARHNFSAHALTDLEVLQAVSLAGDTIFTIGKASIEFTRRPPSP